MTSNDLDDIDRNLLIEILEEDYYEFFLYFWDCTSSEEFIDNFHIKSVCDELQAVGERVIKRLPKEHELVVNIPPGSTKSTMCTILFPVWLWVRDASLQIITTSHDGSLSRKHAIDSRDVIKLEKFQELFGDRFQVRKDIDAKGFYKNDKGGFRVATSVNAGVTGKHGHILIADDLIDPKGAASEVKLETANNYLNKTLNSRKVDKVNTPTILVMQRLHEDDPTGNWLEKAKGGKKKIRHVCFPATDEYPISPEEYKKNYVTIDKIGYFDPVRLSKEVLDEEMGSLGTVGYAGQYGQQPADKEGNKVKYEWFNYCDLWEVPRGLVWDMWVDGAYTKKTENSPTGLMICAYHERTNRLYIRHAREDFMEMPELLELVPSYGVDQGLKRNSSIYIEPKASGKTLAQLLNSDKKYIYDAIEIESHLVSEGKTARLNCASPKIQSGKFWLVKGNWNDKFTGQICMYPRAKKKEFVDLAGYAADHYFQFDSDSGVKRTN